MNGNVNWEAWARTLAKHLEAILPSVEDGLTKEVVAAEEALADYFYEVFYEVTP